MKRLNNKLSYALYILLALVILSGCSDVYPTGNDFSVLKMESYGEGKYKYQMQSLEGSGGFYMVSEHFYKLGDTLTLKPN